MTQQEEVYWQGFIDKCAELGVDPEELAKQAQLGAALKGVATSITPSARNALAAILRALRKRLPHGAAALLGGASPRSAIPKALSAAGRFAGGAATVPVNILRALSANPEFLIPRSLAGRVGETAGMVSPFALGGLWGLKRYLGGGEEESAAPSFGAAHPSLRKEWEAKGWGPEGNPELVKLVRSLQERYGAGRGERGARAGKSTPPPSGVAHMFERSPARIAQTNSILALLNSPAGKALQQR